MVHHDPTQEQKKTDPGFPILEPTCFRSLAKKVLVFWGTYFPGGGTWVFFGWVCDARDFKLAPRSKKNFP